MHTVESAPTAKVHLYDSDFTPTRTLIIQGIARATVEEVVADRQQRIWLRGDITLSNGGQRRLVRLLPDAVLDPAFDAGPGLLARLQFAPLPDGGALLIEGNLESRLTRLLPSGQLDPNFIRAIAWSFAVQPDGRIIHAWSGDAPDGRLNLARALVNGSPDPSFSAGVATGTGRRGRAVQLENVTDLLLTSWGEIVVAATGSFADASVVWVGADGAVRAAYSAPDTEGSRFVLLGSDDERAIYASGGGFGAWRFPSSTVREHIPGLSDMRVQGIRGRWKTPQGLFVTYEPNSIGVSTVPRSVRIMTGARGHFRLANLSSRGVAGGGADALIIGFVLSGPGTTPCLLRGIGPALASFGVQGADPNPGLELYRGEQRLAQNDDWSTAEGSIATMAEKVGAFALPAQSRDAALGPSLDAGAYTMVLRSQGANSGVVLGEVYETTTTAAQLANLSVRGHVGRDSAALIGGFVITGTSPR